MNKEQLERNERTHLGFWIYLMTDLIMFAVLFACYAVLKNNSFGGPTSNDLFELPLALSETLILLTSTFTCGLAMLAVNARDKLKTIFFFALTFVLGISFLILELSEFSHFFAEGASYTRSAFLSSFFALVGTHGLHILAGLFWMGIMLFQVIRFGLTEGNIRKLTLLSIFWHFLDIVWIFIFTIVYLMGVAI